MLVAAIVFTAAHAGSAWADTVAVVPGTTLLTGIACSSGTTCVATGQAGAQNTGVVVPITNGSPGSAQPVSGTNELYGAACASSTTCYAVGVGNFASDGMLVPITGGTAGSALDITGTGFLRGIACASPTFCVAGGWQNGNYNNGAGRIGVIVPITDGTPGGAQQLSGALDVLGVACPTSTTCIGVGTAAESPGTIASIVVTITNGAAGAIQTISGVQLDAVACTTSTDCYAVGGTGSGNAGGGAVVVPITSGSAGGVEQAPGITTLAGVTCPAASTCEAAGWWTAATEAGVTSITGGVPSAALPTPAVFQLYGVACPSDASCMAAGDNSSDGYGVIASFAPAIPAAVVDGPNFTQAKRDAQADLPAALKNAIVYCTPTAIGLGSLGVGTLMIGTSSPLAIAGALTAYATQPFCLATIKRVLLDYRRYKDPPAPDYTQLADPVPVTGLMAPSCKRRHGQLRAFCAALEAAEGSWVNVAGMLASVEQALETTVARESAAVAAGDQASVTLQDGHLPMLEQQEHAALKAEGGAGKAIARLLRTHGISYRMNKAQSRKTITAVERYLAKQGLPAAALTQVVGAGALRPRAINILAALAG